MIQAFGIAVLVIIIIGLFGGTAYMVAEDHGWLVGIGVVVGAFALTAILVLASMAAGGAFS